MPITVCLTPDGTFNYPQGGGHLWVYLNWALGLKSLGCRVIWLECVRPAERLEDDLERLRVLRDQLSAFGLGNSLAVHSLGPIPAARRLTESCMGLDAAAEADLLLNQKYNLAEEVVRRFRRSCLLDIDPGLLQLWMSRGEIRPARHDLYFTTGETVGQPSATFPDCGIEWHYTAPPVALDHWPVHGPATAGRFTTVSHWRTDDWVVIQGKAFRNDKRTGFLPFRELPRHTNQPLELALYLKESDPEFAELRGSGWSVRPSWEVSSSSEQYRRYIQDALGEFSCAKPSCVLLQNAWVSDRTLCFLASGKPGVVQDTGPSRTLPDAAGLFRFRDIDGAARALDAVAADYDHQCALARALAEEHFDAKKVVGRVLETALG